MIRRVLRELNYKEVEEQLNEWLKENAKVPEGEWVSGDGKALKNTVLNYDDSQQVFFNFVSFFSHQKGGVMGVKVMNNKETSEIQTLEDLLDILDKYLSKINYTYLTPPCLLQECLLPFFTRKFILHDYLARESPFPSMPCIVKKNAR